MLNNSYKSSLALRRRAEELRRMQIFAETNFKRRDTDISDEAIESLINIAFKSTITCHDTLESLVGIPRKSGRFFLLNNGRQQIAKLREEFDSLYKAEKVFKPDKNIHLNEFFMTTNNLLLSCDLNLANKELEISKK